MTAVRLVMKMEEHVPASLAEAPVLTGDLD
jgi:hypothetical protein